MELPRCVFFGLNLTLRSLKSVKITHMASNLAPSSFAEPNFAQKLVGSMIRLFCPAALRLSSADAHEFHDTARYIPILNIEIAVFVPVGTVRSTEAALHPLFLRHVEALPFFSIRIVS